MHGRTPWVFSGAHCTARSYTAAAEPVHAAAAPHQLGSPCTACLWNKTNRKQKKETKRVTVPVGSGNTFFQAVRPGKLPHSGELPRAQPLQHQGSVRELCEGERGKKNLGTCGKFANASSRPITKKEEMPVALAAVFAASRSSSCTENTKPFCFTLALFHWQTRVVRNQTVWHSNQKIAIRSDTTKNGEVDHFEIYATEAYLLSRLQLLQFLSLDCLLVSSGLGLGRHCSDFCTLCL